MLNCPDLSKIGIEGFILNETQKTLVIETQDGTKMIPKKDCVFDIYFDKWVKIEGNKILLRPEDRIKLAKKR